MDDLFEHFGKIFAVWAVFCLAVLVGVIVVAVHFLEKVW